MVSLIATRQTAIPASRVEPRILVEPQSLTSIVKWKVTTGTRPVTDLVVGVEQHR